MFKLARTTRSISILALAGAAVLLPACATLEFLGSLGEDEKTEVGSLSPDIRRADPDSPFRDTPRRPWLNPEDQEAERAPARTNTTSESRDFPLADDEMDDVEARPAIQMGMSRSEVRRIWGTPAEVEVAGDPSEGNLRWIYPLSTHRDLADSRIVTFESGRVAGWETVRPD